MRRRRSRSRRLAAFVASAVLALAADAGAHGGTLLLEREAGPYGVALHGGPARRDPGAVDFTVTLRRERRPEEAASVRLQVRTETGWSRAYHARRAANTYEVVLSQPERDSWRSWDLRLHVQGAAGRVTVLHDAAGLDAGSPAPAPAAIVASLAAVAAAGVAATALRRRRPGRAGQPPRSAVRRERASRADRT